MQTNSKPNSTEEVKKAKEAEHAEFMKQMRKNHRQRVKNKYYETGFDGMAPHNVIEFLLFFGIPQKDTKELAYRLIHRFNSFDKILEASMKDLMAVEGMTENAACLLTMILPLYKYYIDNLKDKKPCTSPIEEIVEEIRPTFLKGVCREQSWAYCYDYNGAFIAKRCLSMGDISSSLFDLRALASFVLETNCSTVILAHNHPHGIDQPSNDDISATSKAYHLLKTLKVYLKDHIIVTDASYVSLAHHPASMPIFYDLEGYDPIKEYEEKMKKQRKK